MTYSANRYSYSAQIQARFERHKTRRNIAAFLYVASYIVYLCWRVTIINHDSFALSLTYFVAEIIGFLLGLTIIISSRNYCHRVPMPLLKRRTVDVLVPVYKEPIELIRRTLIAAKEIDYLHNTLVLDDGRREDVKALAAELNISYLSRPNNSHAKAGNLNFGLAHSKAEFVLVFDADHIAMPHAINIMLGFFADKKVALVQTPQEYYNTNAFQYINSKSGALWHDQSFFYNIGQSCVDGFNASSCVGTGVMYRRQALDAIGGIPTLTLTEDIHTSLKLHKQGYQTIYLNEPIAYGEAAPDLKEYYKTRHRWGYGNLHAVAAENVLFGKGFTLKQRIAYISLVFIHLEGWQQLLLFSIPIATLIFGAQPFEISIFNVLGVFFFPFLSYLLLQEIGCGLARFWASEIFSMSRWPMHIKASLGIFGGKMPWQTTLKGLKSKVDWHLMLPQITVMLVSVTALVYGIIKIQGNFTGGPLYNGIVSLIIYGKLPEGLTIFTTMKAGYTIDLVVVSGFWAFYNALRALIFVIRVIRNAKNSEVFFRFNIPLIASQRNGEYARIKRISEASLDAILFNVKTPLQVGEVIPITLLLPACKLYVKIKIRKIRYKKQSHLAIIDGDFIWGSKPHQRDKLARCLYSCDWHREFLNRQSYFLTPLDVITSILTLRRPYASALPTKAWNAAMINLGKNQTVCGVVANEKTSKNQAILIAFESFAPKQELDITIFSNNNILTTRAWVQEELPVSSLAHKGLDGKIVRRYRLSLESTAKQNLQKI